MGNSVSNTTLFLYIGNVLLSNGWGHESRQIAATETFHPNSVEVEDRDHFDMGIQEEGKLTLSEYLNRLVFYEERSFTVDQFREFIFTHTTPNLEMIEFTEQLKKQYKLKITVINNEGRVLNEYRIKKFQLTQFVDFFISSCFIHYRKPDTGIMCLALDTMQVPAEQAVDIEDLQMFVDVVRGMGIQSIRHKNYLSTSEILASLGLRMG